MASWLCLLGAAPLVAACGSSAAAPLPAGRDPSAVSRMVCSTEARTKLDDALSMAASSVSDPLWVHHLYSCTFRFATGALSLSVKELSSSLETTAYFNSLAARLGRSQTLYGLGQGAFVTSDGSVVARKDYKVLLVDTSAYAGGTRAATTGSANPAEIVASTIMTCWAGD